MEKGELPLIAAHRGGGTNNPENTMLAFREAVKTYNVEIIESDLYLTKDGYLVYNHDDYIDETCNVNGDITFDEVKQLCKDVKLPAFKELGVDKADFEQIAEMSVKNISTESNPRPMDKQDYLNVLNAAYDEIFVQ